MRIRQVALLFLLNTLVVSGLVYSNPTLQQMGPGGRTEEIINNEAVIELLKAGIDEDIIITKIQKVKSNLDTSVQGMVALKKAGASDRLMHFLMDPTKAPEPKAASTPIQPAATQESQKSVSAGDASRSDIPSEIGVYAKKDNKWQEILPEVVNWKTGGVLKSIGTAGIVKGDVNGRINGSHSRNAARAPLEFMIIAAEGVSITEYQLLHLREQKDAREFRTVTGGVMHVSGGATRDVVPFEGEKVVSRRFLVKLPGLGAGEYGFLPPGSDMSKSSASMGKMYTFRVGE